MKIFFIITLLLAIIIGAHGFLVMLDSARTQARVIAQSASLDMQGTPDYFPNRQQLSEFPKTFAEAYEDAINDSKDMAQYCGKEFRTGQLLAVLLFITSIGGLMACRKKRGQNISNRLVGDR